MKRFVHALILLASPVTFDGWRGGLMISALDSWPSGLGSSPAQGHCMLFLGKAFNFMCSASLHPGA